jgi:23S rRNA (adenine2030-N6)-methyltransferase
MNYRHIYHAGNFADVFKHCILVMLIENLLRKDKSFCYVDTHAGLGIYDLKTISAQKTLEYSLGISRVLGYAGEDIPAEIAPYLSAVKQLNATQAAIEPSKLTGSNISLYPGSPYIARSLLRPHDRMILMELHKEDILQLKQVFSKDKQVAVHHCDGYQGLKAFLPPRERRGLVLIDPSFEHKNEFELILAALKVALARWLTGTYAIWYPIKDFALVKDFLCALNKMNIPTVVSEITIGKQTELKEFIGCGMAILNPPWQLDKTLEKVLPWLWKILSPHHEGRWAITSHPKNS